MSQNGNCAVMVFFVSAHTHTHMYVGVRNGWNDRYASGLTLSDSLSVVFSLSGFVLTHADAYSKCHLTTWRCYRNYYIRRIMRVMPLYYCSLLLTIGELSCIAHNSCRSNVRTWSSLAMYILGIKTWLPIWNFDCQDGEHSDKMRGASYKMCVRAPLARLLSLHIRVCVCACMLSQGIHLCGVFRPSYSFI